MVMITSPDAILGVRLTVDEYLQADLPEGSQYELVDGVINVSPNPDGLHETIVHALYKILVGYEHTHPKAISLISCNSNVPIGGMDRVRQPDLAVFARWKARPRGWGVWKKFRPFLVVEVVSPGQEQRDYEDKRADYWTAGVDHYWIVDPDEETVTVLVRGSRGWQEHRYHPGDVFQPRCLPGLTLHVDDLLGA